MKAWTRQAEKFWKEALVLLLWSFLFIFLSNHPYPQEPKNKTTYYSSIYALPKTLDPVRSYSTDSNLFLSEIVEAPLNYHYLKRPYTLVPYLLETMPEVDYLDAQNQRRSLSDPKVVSTRYRLTFLKGVSYHLHPAFALAGHQSLSHVYANPHDFPEQGSRYMQASDVAYQIKRIADPKLSSPFYSVFVPYLPGLETLRRTIERLEKKHPGRWVDLRLLDCPGVRVISDQELEITLKGAYPSFLYWLAMPLFSPMAWEVDAFYHRPEIQAVGLGHDTFPVGTGAFRLMQYNLTGGVILERHPFDRPRFYPNEGEPEDKQQGLLERSGEAIPTLGRVHFIPEREAIPRWNKFLQGYYDVSALGAEQVQQAIRLNTGGLMELSSTFREKQLRLVRSVQPTWFYWGFNQKDPIYGGNSLRARKLREAIAIAVDLEEFISIFLNGSAKIAQHPIPSVVENFKHCQSKIYDCRDPQHPKRWPLARAQRLMREAGYPEGKDEKTGKHLLIYFDVGADGESAQLLWWSEQFKKLGIHMVVRQTPFAQFYQKLHKGAGQFYPLGWHADYPDAENFLACFFSEQDSVDASGINYTRYQNKDYDTLYQHMRVTPRGKERTELIRQMVDLLHRDNPVLMGFFPEALIVRHHWMAPSKPFELGSGALQYTQIDDAERKRLRTLWNPPLFWPWFSIGVLGVLSWRGLKIYRRRLMQAPPTPRRSAEG